MAPPIVKRFLISLDQNKWLGLLTFLFSLGVATVFAIQPPKAPPSPTYKARGELSFRTPPPAFTSTGTQLQQQGRSISKEMLLSPWVLERVQNKLKLSVEQILAIRDKKLTVLLPGEKEGAKTQTPVPEKTDEQSQPQVITLEYTDPESPTQATLYLDTFMREMVEYSRWTNTSQLRSRIEALTKRLGQVQTDLTAAEGKFYGYISKEGSDLLAIQDGSLFSAITSSQQKQRELKLTLQDIEGQINSLTGQLGLNPKQAYTSVALSADPIIASLRARILDNELQYESLKKDLRPEHPTLTRLLKDKQVNETLLKQRAEELIGRTGLFTPLTGEIRRDSNLDPTRQQLANQLVALQTQREGLLKQLASVIKTEQELRQQYEQSPDKQLRQARLVQGVEFQRIVYQNILTALVDAQAAEAETVSSLAITQAANYQQAPPYKPQPKNIPLIMLAGAGIGLLAGTGLILLLALVDDRLHTPQELREALTDREVPLLGQLPLIPLSLANEEQKPILLDGDSAYLSFYERFRSNIRRLRSDSSKVIIITSISNEEGKSISAYNLAIAAAQAGKRTLLVEADLRSPSQAQMLNITPNPDASLEPLRYYAARSDAISLVPSIANLYILPSPGPQRQAAAIIESSELQLLLKDARGRFDLVIIDTPSLSRCNDALLLEPLSDGIVLVTRPGTTRTSLLNEAIDQFTEAEVPVLGAVINGVEGLGQPNPTLPEPTLVEMDGSDSQESSRVEA